MTGHAPQGESTAPLCNCGTELTRCNGRRRGTHYWWCWKCEKAVKPQGGQR